MVDTVVDGSERCGRSASLLDVLGTLALTLGYSFFLIEKILFEHSGGNLRPQNLRMYFSPFFKIIIVSKINVLKRYFRVF